MNTGSVLIPNALIRDSAGAGKTFKLTNRFIRLLYHGQPPERIIALTFTRKAAGEFFAGILTKLAGAASNVGKAKKLGEFIEIKNAQPTDFHAALRRLIESMGRLSLGTIDSFFNRMLTMFPMEFGLGGGFTMMSEFDKHQARLHALESLMSYNSASKSGQDSLVQSFHLATAGQNNFDFIKAFEEHLTNCHELLLRAPRADQWGNISPIWLNGFPWTDTTSDLTRLVDEWREHLNNEHDYPAGVQQGFETTADHLTRWAPGKDILPRTKKTLLKFALENFNDLTQGKWEFVFNRKSYQPSGDFSRALARILQHCVSCELNSKLQRTQGIHGLLTTFETHYDEQVRRQGRLAFADLPALLGSTKGHGLLGGAGPDHLDFEYRLDGAFDHWLLDEFQDTSMAQWGVIDNLIDEVMQDPSGNRTFFCIGDQKQSIYQWRGGDPRLLDRVVDRYKNGLEVPAHDGEANTYRCCNEIVDLLNAVFGDAGILGEFDENAANRWSAIWETHVSKNNAPGHVQYLTVANKEDRWPMVAHLLERIRPIENRLCCAILVQTNKAVREIVEYLRGALPNLPVIGDSVTKPAADNPLGAALLSLFRAAAHPSDKYSIGHLRLTPFAEHLPSDDGEWASTMRNLQHDIHQRGFEAVTRDWINHLAPQLDFFSHWRAGQFLEMVRQFDETGNRSIDEFLRFIPAQEHAEAAAANMIQVMTIHKAKGLTFDVTLVPDLEGNRLDEPRKDALHIHSTAEGEIDWILDLPRQDICNIDGPLSQALAGARSDACYENFCKLYVALTRGRQGLYIITTALNPRSKSNNYVRLLTETLSKSDGTPIPDAPISATEIFTRGKWNWIKKKILKPTPSVPALKTIKTERICPRQARHRPSVQEDTIVHGENLFQSNRTIAASFGRAVHSIFEQIEWYNENTDSLLKSLSADNPQAVAEVRKCLKSTAITPLFEPISNAQVWRERAFELVIDGEFFSGVFDRVVLHKDTADIIDFKTGRVENDTINDTVDRHRPQLSIYRKALAALTGISESSITCLLIFTHLAGIETVD